MSCALSFNYCQLVWFMKLLILLERSEITIYLHWKSRRFFLKPALLRQNQWEMLSWPFWCRCRKCFFLSLLFDRPGKEHRTWISLWCSCRAEMILNKCTASVFFFFVFFLKGVSINNYFYKAHFSLQSFFITVINFFFLNNPKCVPYKEMASYSAIKILHVVFL